jgi:hypothetical protein
LHQHLLELFGFFHPRARVRFRELALERLGVADLRRRFAELFGEPATATVRLTLSPC